MFPGFTAYACYGGKSAFGIYLEEKLSVKFKAGKLTFCCTRVDIDSVFADFAIKAQAERAALKLLTEDLMALSASLRESDEAEYLGIQIEEILAWALSLKQEILAEAAGDG